MLSNLKPFFGNNELSKTFLEYKFTNKTFDNPIWEQFGSLVKDTHKNSLNKYINILSKDLSPFEIDLLQNNFKLFKNNTDITNKPSLWKYTTNIIPFKTFHQDKIILQGYHKNNFHNNIQIGGFKNIITIEKNINTILKTYLFNELFDDIISIKLVEIFNNINNTKEQIYEYFNILNDKLEEYNNKINLSKKNKIIPLNILLNDKNNIELFIKQYLSKKL